MQGALHVGVDLTVLLGQDPETVQRDQGRCTHRQIKFAQVVRTPRLREHNPQAGLLLQAESTLRMRFRDVLEVRRPMARGLLPSLRQRRNHCAQYEPSCRQMPELQSPNLQNLRLQPHDLLPLQQGVVLDLSAGNGELFGALQSGGDFRLRRYAGHTPIHHLVDLPSLTVVALYAFHPRRKLLVLVWQAFRAPLQRRVDHRCRVLVRRLWASTGIDPRCNNAPHCADLPRLRHRHVHLAQLRLLLLLLNDTSRRPSNKTDQLPI